MDTGIEFKIEIEIPEGEKKGKINMNKSEDSEENEIEWMISDFFCCLQPLCLSMM